MLSDFFNNPFNIQICFNNPFNSSLSLSCNWFVDSEMHIMGCSFDYKSYFYYCINKVSGALKEGRWDDEQQQLLH